MPLMALKQKAFSFLLQSFSQVPMLVGFFFFPHLLFHVLNKETLKFKIISMNLTIHLYIVQCYFKCKWELIEPVCRITEITQFLFRSYVRMYFVFPRKQKRCTKRAHLFLFHFLLHTCSTNTLYLWLTGDKGSIFSLSPSVSTGRIPWLFLRTQLPFPAFKANSGSNRKCGLSGLPSPTLGPRGQGLTSSLWGVSPTPHTPWTHRSSEVTDTVNVCAGRSPGSCRRAPCLRLMCSHYHWTSLTNPKFNDQNHFEF